MAVAAFFGAMGLAIRKIYRMARHIEETLDAVTVNATLAQRLEMQLHDIQKEVKPNGGTSLRDAVNRIESRMGALEASCPRLRDTIEATPTDP